MAEQNAQSHKNEKIGYVVLGQPDIATLSRRFDNDTLVSVARGAADMLAEQSGWLGMVCYVDAPEQSDLVQFRIRRSHLYKALDLRGVLKILSITNGGGHEGAIGFRVPKTEIPDLDLYVAGLIRKVEKMIHG